MNNRLDSGPMARLEAMKADPQAPSVIFQRVCDGETLRELAKAWGLPKGRFVEWFTTQHATLYDTALKVRADDLAHEALSVADSQTEVVKENGQKFDPDVPRDKLRVDTRLKLASRWDRARYGEQTPVVALPPIEINIGIRKTQIAVLQQQKQEAAQPLLSPPERSEADTLI